MATSTSKSLEVSTEFLRDKKKSGHKPSPSNSIYYNCSLEHISYFNFNNQILIKEITFSNSCYTPLLNFRCSAGAAPVLTPYSEDLLEFTVDPESNLPSTDSLLLKINYDQELDLLFYFDQGIIGVSGDDDGEDWYLIHTHSSPELGNILQNINNDNSYIVKNENIYPVNLDFKKNTLRNSGTSFSDSIQWLWRWNPLINAEVINGGYKNICALVKRSSENFYLIAEFSFWLNVHTYRVRKSSISSNKAHIRKASLASIPNLSRAPSKQNIQDLSPQEDGPEPIFEFIDHIPKAIQQEVDVNLVTHEENKVLSPIQEALSPNPLMDINFNEKLEYADDDGPVFRATLNQLEKRVSSFKHDIKRIIKLGQELVESKREANEVEQEFFDTIMNLPAISHLSQTFLYEAALLIKSNQESYIYNLITYLTDPLKKIYDNEIKLAESKKKSFDQESDEFYSYLSKYLSATKDKGRKSNFSDVKYQQRQKQFELARFNYYTFIHELRGGGKDQEILHYFTSFADKVTVNYFNLNNGLIQLKPKLDQLLFQIEDANKKLLLQRKDRDEKRRMIIKSDSDLSEMMFVNSINEATAAKNGYNPSKISHTHSGSKSKFHGIRDLQSTNREATIAIGRKREGFLFTQTKPLKNTGPGKFDKNLPGQNSWHKKWCVLSGGYLHEYNNWKKQLEANFEPIPLQFATVRVANQANRKFCFEIVTPKFRRQYQATSEDDMSSWIAVITNSIESIWNGTSSCDDLKGLPSSKLNKIGNGLDNTKFGKSPHSHSPLSQEISNTNDFLNRQYLIELLRKKEANLICADCDSSNPEWCSINFGILLCIECSGIHRSLGTHVTKIRSLTLDVVTFTPDLVALLEKIGNENSNLYWEHLLDENKLFVDEISGTKWVKPTSIDERAFKLRYITAKYVDHMFLLPDIPCPDLNRETVDIFVDQLVHVPEAQKLATASIFTGVYLDCAMPILQAINFNGLIDGFIQVKPGSLLVKPFGVNNQITPLHLALFLNLDEETDGKEPLYYIAELLVQNGANVNIQLPGSQYSLLHFASIHNDLAAIQYLLLKGANPNFPLDDPELWPCFLSSDFACQQLLFEVTYNEAVKINCDENILSKLTPVLPPRIRSDDEADTESDFKENEGAGSPPSAYLELKSNLSEVGKLTPPNHQDQQSDPNSTEMIRSMSSDNRSPSGPIKRLSGGWKQQLQNFKNNKDRDHFVPSHGHSHSMTITSSSPGISFSSPKKNIFRRSGHPFMPQDLNYLASSAPSNVSQTLPKHLPSPLEHRTSSYSGISNNDSDYSKLSSSASNHPNKSPLASFNQVKDDISLNSSNTYLSSHIRSLNQGNSELSRSGSSNYPMPPNMLLNSSNKLQNPFMVNNDNQDRNDKKNKPIRASSIIDAFRKLSK